MSIRVYGFWLIDIPSSRSADLEGNMGTLTIIPN